MRARRSSAPDPGSAWSTTPAGCTPTGCGPATSATRERARELTDEHSARANAADERERGGRVRPFRRKGEDVVARFDPAEAGIVGLLLDQLEQLLAADEDDLGDDPVLARLLPEGHRGDPRLAADYRELTESALRSGKADDLATVRATLPLEGGDVRLDPEQAGAWLRSTNDLRLALGTRLQITEDTEPPEDATGEEGQQLAVYYWLTALQGSLVDALAAGRADRR